MFDAGALKRCEECMSYSAAYPGLKVAIFNYLRAGHTWNVLALYRERVLVVKLA
jgi:hypothetical protein